MNSLFKLLGQTAGLLILGLAFGAAAHGATYTVTKTADTNDGVCDGDCSLREAIAAANATADNDVINFDASVFAGTQTITLGGSQLSIANNGSLTINGTGARLLTVSGNNASRVFYISPGANAAISGLTVTRGNGNGSVGWNTCGGGIFNDTATLTLKNSAVSGNSVPFGSNCNDGSGIMNWFGGTLNVVNSTVNNNTGAAGIATFTGTVNVVNSTISNNSGNWSGGIDATGSPTVNLTNVTISGNAASGTFSFEGAGIRINGATFNVRNTIIANSTGADCYSGGTLNIQNSLVEDGSCSVTSGVNNNLTGDPHLAPLGYNGGATQTHALLPTSPAINAGNNCVTDLTCASNNPATALTTDQRGAPRNGNVDIGAFELDNDTDGDGVRDFTDNCPTTPNPEKIAFSSDRDGNNEIYVMNADGTNQIRLTNNEASDYAPSFSSDGSKIAFTSDRDGNGEIYVMNVDGTNQTRLTDTPTNEDRPRFSPDGSKIAFQSYRNGNSDVFVINADGSNEINVTNNGNPDYEPTFSPDGSKIAFRSPRSGGQEDIYLVNADGSGNTVNLTNRPGHDIMPSFSPDGSKIVFVSFRDGNWEIYVMNSNGSNQTRLTNHGAFDWRPSFSPDGSKIIFDSYRSDNSEIYMINADGSNLVNLTNNAATEFGSSWGRQADSDGDGIGDACEVPEDSTPPVITPTVTGTLGNNDWYVSDIQISWSVVDNESTVSNQTGCDMQTVSTDTDGITFTCEAQSAGGMSSQSVTVKRDATAPTLNPSVSPNPVLLGGTAIASPNATDALSGVASESCDTPNTSTVGSKSVNCTATDNAGNTASASANYRVVYNFAGFFQPIDNLPMVNISTAGQAIPIKFSLSGYQGLAIFAAGYPASGAVPCSAGEPGSTVEETVSAGGSSLSYNASTDQYSYVWKTDKSWKGTCRILVVRLIDGNEYYAKFRFK